MFLINSACAKNIYRKLSKRTVELKNVHPHFSVRKSLQNCDNLHLVRSKSQRYLHTSILHYEKSKSVSNIQSSTDDKREEQKKPAEVIKQNPVGDIVVKTELDVDKVVTKVTIEKKTPTSPEPEPVKPPGKLKRSFAIMFLKKSFC